MLTFSGKRITAFDPRFALTFAVWEGGAWVGESSYGSARSSLACASYRLMPVLCPATRRSHQRQPHRPRLLQSQCPRPHHHLRLYLRLHHLRPRLLRQRHQSLGPGSWSTPIPEGSSTEATSARRSRRPASSRSSPPYSLFSIFSPATGCRSAPWPRVCRPARST
jgi:hypothetical protein